MQTLWPDSFVEESSLTQNVSLLRRALGETNDGRQYIETLPKRGYRFVVDVREVDESETEVVMKQRTTTEIVVEEEEHSATRKLQRHGLRVHYVDGVSAAVQFRGHAR